MPRWTTLTKARVTNTFGPFETGPWVRILTSPASLLYPIDAAGNITGSVEPQTRIVVQPYGDGPPGYQFSVRVFAWNRIGDNLVKAIWTGSLLCELLCTIGDISVPDTGVEVQNGPVIGPAMRFCDSIVPSAGSLGITGFAYSCGAGSGILAQVIMETNCPRLLSFDFNGWDAQGNTDTNVQMNALWAYNDQEVN